MHDVGKEAGSWAVLGPGHAQEGKGVQDNHEGKQGQGAQGMTPEDSDEVKGHDENKEGNDEGKGHKGKAALDSLHSLHSLNFDEQRARIRNRAALHSLLARLLA